MHNPALLSRIQIHENELSPAGDPVKAQPLRFGQGQPFRQNTGSFHLESLHEIKPLNMGTQCAHNGFHFRKFRHISLLAPRGADCIISRPCVSRLTGEMKGRTHYTPQGICAVL